MPLIASMFSSVAPAWNVPNLPSAAMVLEYDTATELPLSVNQVVEFVPSDVIRAFFSAVALMALSGSELSSAETLPCAKEKPIAVTANAPRAAVEKRKSFFLMGKTSS